MSTIDIGTRPFPAILHLKRDSEAGVQVARYVPERTCRVVPMDAAGNPPFREGDWLLNELSDGCGMCGYPFDSKNHGAPRYCPNCGAQVIDDE